MRHATSRTHFHTLTSAGFTKHGRSTSKPPDTMAKRWNSSRASPRLLRDCTDCRRCLTSERSKVRTRIEESVFLTFHSSPFTFHYLRLLPSLIHGDVNNLGFSHSHLLRLQSYSLGFDNDASRHRSVSHVH